MRIRFSRSSSAFVRGRTPVEVERANGVCDERIGRICIWFGGDEGEGFPSEFREVTQARVELIRGLFDAFEQVGDRWIIGQLVHYLVESPNMGEAQTGRDGMRGSGRRGGAPHFAGYVLHVWTRYVDAEAAFREALAAMPGRGVAGVDGRPATSSPQMPRKNSTALHRWSVSGSGSSSGACRIRSSFSRATIV